MTVEVFHPKVALAKSGSPVQAPLGVAGTIGRGTSRGECTEVPSATASSHSGHGYNAAPGGSQALLQDRETLISELKNSARTSASIKRLLSSQYLSRYVEQSAIVFKEARASGEAINLHHVEERFSRESSLLVGALLQHGLVKSFHGLAREFEQRVRECVPAAAFNLSGLGIQADTAIQLDGEWGEHSQRLRSDVAELMYRLIHFETGRAIPPVNSSEGGDTEIDNSILGVIRWFSPHHAACMVPLDENSQAVSEFRALRVSGRQDAGLANRRASGISFAQRMTPPDRATPEFVKKAI